MASNKLCHNSYAELSLVDYQYKGSSTRDYRDYDHIQNAWDEQQLKNRTMSISTGKCRRRKVRFFETATVLINLFWAKALKPFKSRPISSDGLH